MTKLTDPVCRMGVFTPIFRSDYNGKEYVFCSMSCKLRFDKTPEKYVK